ncbi:MAG: hypothetical protein Q9184_000034 [Pyrenodesmia sp. 2 TL-2023]
MAAVAGSELPFTSVLESSVDDLRNLVACRICIRPMYEPYTTQCGHTFCYTCLRQWFDRDHGKMTCPDCRAHVKHQPAPAYLVREIAQTFVNTAALLPPGETTEDHKNIQREEAEIIEQDRTDEGRFGGLFKGRFKHHFHHPAPIRDGPDGVDRCPMCTWEIEDGMCASCGYTVLDPGPYEGNYRQAYANLFAAHDDDESYPSDTQSFDLSEIEEEFANDPEELGYGSTGSGSSMRIARRRLEHIRREVGLPTRAPLRRRRQSHTMSPLSHLESSEYDYSSDGFGSPGSLQEFMVDDTAIDDAFSSDRSEHTDNALTYSGRGSSSEPSQQREPSFDPDPGESSDSTAINTGSRRSRGRPIATSSPDVSDDDVGLDSDSDQSAHPLSPHDEGSQSGGGFSPLQHNSEDGGSQHIPIQVDSDSDGPPVRRTRNRPTAASTMSSDEGESEAPPVRRRRKRPAAALAMLSSDEEDDGARGVNINRSPALDLTPRGPSTAIRQRVALPNSSDQLTYSRHCQRDPHLELLTPGHQLDPHLVRHVRTWNNVANASGKPAEIDYEDISTKDLAVRWTP